MCLLFQTESEKKLVNASFGKMKKQEELVEKKLKELRALSGENDWALLGDLLRYGFRCFYLLDA